MQDWDFIEKERKGKERKGKVHFARILIHVYSPRIFLEP